MLSDIIFSIYLLQMGKLSPQILQGTSSLLRLFYSSQNNLFHTEKFFTWQRTDPLISTFASRGAANQISEESMIMQI